MSATDKQPPDTAKTSDDKAKPAVVVDDNKRRATLAKAVSTAADSPAPKCKPDEILSWRDYSDRTVVVVCTATFCGKVEIAL